MPFDFDDNDLRGFSCLGCGKYLGHVSVWQNREQAIQSLRQSLSYHCPRCGRELNSDGKSQPDLYFWYRSSLWHLKALRHWLRKDKPLRFRPMKLSRRSKIFAITSTSILIWGGQTYIWNPFWLYYQAYPWYALIWAFTITWIIPKRDKHKKSNLLDDPLPPPSLESLQEPDEAWLKE